MYLLWMSCNFSFKLSNGQCNNKTFKDTSQCHKFFFFFFSLLRRKTTVPDAKSKLIYLKSLHKEGIHPII